MVLEIDREAPQQAETVPSHFNQVASWKLERFRPKHIAEKGRAETNDMGWHKHMLGNEEPNRTKRREKEEPRRETDLKDNSHVTAHAVFLAH